MAATSDDRVGPHPSYIEVARSYMLQSTIQQCLDKIGMSEGREDAVRLQGVAWIDNVGKSLLLPVRTFNTAVVYFHKFRLLHADSEYNVSDAAAAALFTACKIEDTLKKSKEILCAAWNLKLPPSEHLSPDDPRFDPHSKIILGLERLMLESSSFDFRNRYPQDVMVRMMRDSGHFEFIPHGKTASHVSTDMYRTFAPLKQTTNTMALACIELSARLHGMDMEKIVDAGVLNYTRWKTSRAEVMETLLDLLDLYTHHRTSTIIGPLYDLEAFLGIRITLNNEASAANIPRYFSKSSPTPSPAAPHQNGTKPRNGIEYPSPITPATPGTISPGQTTSVIGVRGQNGTVRFMIDAERAREETAAVDKYFKTEEEEYEVEVPIESERRRPPR
ncbi:cyclin [Amniculicola lignicola CBS 123094]|uniref:RNA polymerase II holoenzyme cyclin-like subunit n=1 Tax=Amniculicola lignicola CBS 123094 TaxID=1392246 RepID=A0A6A5WS30_9PLEO|nr:cyclin [Amniculicola lignicola CBS 123094]